MSTLYHSAYKLQNLVLVQAKITEKMYLQIIVTLGNFKLSELYLAMSLYIMQYIRSATVLDAFKSLDILLLCNLFIGKGIA